MTSPFTPPRARTATSLAAAVLVLTACGGDPPEPVSSTPRWLDSRRIQQLAGSGPAAGPRKAALRFWREVQFNNLPRAYELLDPASRTRSGYRTFVTAMVNSAPIFLANPTAAAATLRGHEADVTIRFAVGASPRQPQSPLRLRLVYQDGGWLVRAVPAPPTDRAR